MAAALNIMGPMAAADRLAILHMLVPDWHGLAWRSLLSRYASPLAMSRFAACINLRHAWVAPNPQTPIWEWLWP